MSISPSDLPVVAALYFDGESSRAHAATLTLDGGHLNLVADGISRSEPLAAMRLSEPMGSAPRIITFPDGAHAEVRDHAALARLLAASGHRDAATVRGAFDARVVIACLIGLVVLFWGGARFALPWAAEVAAARVPDEVVSVMSANTLDFIDGRLLDESTLDPAVQRRLEAALADRTRVPHSLLFRAGGPIGPNAFALPDGTLIVTDELVDLAGDDERVLAVLMHELGHVELRHGIRMAMQGSAVALFLAWYAGDVSSLLAMAPTALLQSGYSRDMEREADDYAARALREQGRSPALLAEMLERLVRAYRRDGGEPGGWLSSHPASTERIERLRHGDFTSD